MTKNLKNFAKFLRTKQGLCSNRLPAAAWPAGSPRRRGPCVTCFLPFQRPRRDCESSGRGISHSKKKSARALDRQAGDGDTVTVARIFCGAPARPPLVSCPCPAPASRDDVVVTRSFSSGTRDATDPPTLWIPDVCVAACGRAFRLCRELIRRLGDRTGPYPFDSGLV